MIEQIVKLLALDDWVGCTENIDIAKGKNRLPLTFREAWQQNKREKQWLKK